MATEAEQYAQAEEAARQWQPRFVRDGTGLLPNATPIEQILATPQRPLAPPMHSPSPIRKQTPMEFPMTPAGGTFPPPPPEGSGDDPGP